MKFIINKIKENRAAAALSAAVNNNKLPAYATGLCESYKLFLTAMLCCDNERGILVVPDFSDAQRLHDLFSVIYDPDDILLFPSREYIFYNFENISRTSELQRISALFKMSRGKYKLALIPADALSQLLPGREQFDKNALTISVGKTIALDMLLAHLSVCGYTRTELTDCPGQFSHRGGIVEFFSPNYSYPVRLELFGDEIDSLAFYDPKTQRRIENADSVTLLPVLEVIADEQARLLAQEHIKKHIAKLKRKGGYEEALSACAADLENIKNIRFPAIDRYLPLISQEPQTVLDYDPQALVFCYDLAKVKGAFRGFAYKTGEDIAALAEKGLSTVSGDYFFPAGKLLALFERRGLILLEDYLRQENDIVFKHVCSFSVKNLTPPTSDNALCEDLQYYTQSDYCCAVFGGSAARGSFLPQLFSEKNISSHYITGIDGELVPGIVSIIGQGFPGGFEDRDAKFALIGSSRLSAAKGSKKRRFEVGEKISDFSDISVGDYIVHANYGIGIYDGVHKVETQGVIRDFIKIRYAGTDTLFIPCGQFDLISKYIGASPDIKVKLNKLGTGEWARAKARVSATVKDLAKQLISLYSARKNVQGFAFSPDSDWQRQFESAFEFEETDDQHRCCDEIKEDMCKPYPMDRLLCGDVGFGKTEVALRAAFKCVLDGKQVAILVPTTILAWQHYNTMLRRFEGFPVTVQLLSRFRTPTQQQAILRRLRRGEIDIVVGTHRIIQKDVKFKDLGLLVVDEEQRFGVSHKEALKEMTQSVDVLTLTATPIPRTLNMALSGIRDMSVIEEPPLDRHPISTYVCEYDEGIVIDALRRELARDGQCYYLYNRIETIYKTASRLAAALPDAVIEVAHGQMQKEELSDIWDRMVDGKIDILVCTTIIETGVDVPNANTLIIEDADRLGLAQLHQIRGRVGRSYKHAYAYFTYRKGKSLTEDGRRRLDAIREYTEFGSGFKIAMRDLQIRGAGNLLGAQQHGHMDSVGYDMYMQLLSQAIAEEKGTKAPAAGAECVIDLKTDAYIPESYIDSSYLRVDAYKKIASIQNDEDKSDIIDELIDRFGDIPAMVLTLIDIALIRAYCIQSEITQLSQNDNLLQFFLQDNDFKRISSIISAFSGKMFYSASFKPCLSCRVKGDVISTALDVCRRLAAVCGDIEKGDN